MTTNKQNNSQELPIIPKPSKTININEQKECSCESCVASKKELTEISSKDARKKLRKSGCEEIRQTGSHVQIKCPNGKQTTVPVHGSSDIKKGTLHGMEKSLGMDIDGDGRPSPGKVSEQTDLNESLTWAGKLFFASVAAYIASDISKAMKLPIKLRGKPEQIKAVVDAITASKDFQREIKKPGAKVEDVVQKLNLRNLSKQDFKRLTGREFPV